MEARACRPRNLTYFFLRKISSPRQGFAAEGQPAAALPAPGSPLHLPGPTASPPTLRGQRRRLQGDRKGLSPLGLAGAKACIPVVLLKKPRVWGWDREAKCPAAVPGGRQREPAQGAELGVFLPPGPTTPRCSPSTSPPPCPTGDSHPRPLPGSSGATGASASRGTGREHGTGRGAAHGREGQAGLGVLPSVCLSVCLLLPLLLIR